MEQKLTGEEFNKFFEQLIDSVLSETSKGTNQESLLEIMQKNGFQAPKLPDKVAKKIMPLLTSKTRGIDKIEHNCSWCGVCSLCTACGELNAAAIGAASAGAVHILD
jgi:hypothetical protein